MGGPLNKLMGQRLHHISVLENCFTLANSAAPDAYRSISLGFTLPSKYPFIAFSPRKGGGHFYLVFWTDSI